MTYRSKWRASGDGSDSHATVTVTVTVTSRGRNNSGFTTGGDSGDSKLQGILSWKKKRERQPGGITATAIVTSVMRRTLHFTVTTVTSCHGARNIQASAGDGEGDGDVKLASPRHQSLSSVAGRVAA